MRNLHPTNIAVQVVRICKPIFFSPLTPYIFICNEVFVVYIL
jgi:hypothetical protein